MQYFMASSNLMSLDYYTLQIFSHTVSVNCYYDIFFWFTFANKSRNLSIEMSFIGLKSIVSLTFMRTWFISFSSVITRIQLLTLPFRPSVGVYLYITTFSLLLHFFSAPLYILDIFPPSGTKFKSQKLTLSATISPCIYIAYSPHIFT